MNLKHQFPHLKKSPVAMPPQVTCKVLDLRSNVWSDGPSLPSNPAASSGSGSPPLGLRPGFTRGTAYHRDGKVNAECMTKGCKKEQVRQCLGLSTADL